jgi:hypothetical protein
MYAEALNELNNAPTDEAANALKTVRLRAFKNDATKAGAIPTTYSDFKDAIIKERKLELSNESLRKSDLTRWGILFEHLTNEKAKLFQLARRESIYANVDVYRAYKMVKGVFKNPIIAVPHIAMSDNDIAALNLTEAETTTLNTINASGKGFLEKTFYEDKASGKVYFSKDDAPTGSEVTEVKYTILNMFGCHAVKQSGGLSVDDVTGLASANKWILEMFYGLQKNMVEILPFNTTSIIDVNPGLLGQQHPCY